MKKRAAGCILRHGFLAVVFVACASAQATPFAPSSDAVVLERMPDAGDAAARALLRKHRALAANPHDLTLALDVARGDLDRGRALGDPRFLGRAQAALAPWPLGPGSPPDVMLLRAVVMQSNHDFNGALLALAQVLAARPRNAQAWLTRAAIDQARADYAAAIADCGQFAGLTLGLAPDVCTASAMALTGKAPLALRAVSLSLGVNAAEAARAPGVAMWALTLAAEVAERLGDPSAESWFTRAMSLDPTDPYLLGAWSDWLLDHGRPSEVVSLLTARTRIDPLLLRLALAERATGNPAATGHIADLAARFESSRLRGESVHRREEARFTLELLHEPGRALDLARANWGVQREPADARVLLEAALAARQPVTAGPVLAWLKQNGVQDRHLAGLAERVRQSASGAG